MVARGMSRGGRGTRGSSGREGVSCGRPESAPVSRRSRGSGGFPAAAFPRGECAPGGIRTPDPRIRSPLLCPAELRARYLLSEEYSAFGVKFQSVASIRCARLSKSSRHFCRMEWIRRDACSPNRLRPPPRVSATPRSCANTSKYRSLTSTSARTSAQRQLLGRRRPASNQVSNSSHAFSARKFCPLSSSRSIWSRRWRRPLLPSRSTHRMKSCTMPLYCSRISVKRDNFNAWSMPPSRGS